MRGLIVLAVIVLLLIVVGWISIGDSPERSTISIEKEVIKEDTADMVRQGNELIDDARRAVAPNEGDARQNATEIPVEESVEPMERSVTNGGSPAVMPEEAPARPSVEPTR